MEVGWMNHEKYMEFALILARQAKGQTSPNPSVGAVVVNNGEIVGFGAHLKAGDAHAEVLALHMAGDKANGGTIYVTLEPCSHYGRTAPCADLLIEKNIKHVVIACLDPHERVAGKGIEKLRQAGVKVDVGILEKEAMELNEDFFHYIKMKQPYVTVKTATSLDGKIATVTGESQWITGEDARLDVHRYRDQHDGILVGINTIIADNPSLTTRLPEGGRNPIRIVLDTTLRIPMNSKVIRDGEAETWIFIGKNVSEERKFRFKEIDQVRIIQLDEDEIQVPTVLDVLGKENIMSLFVEGGAEINGSFLKSRRINQVITYFSPKLIGGRKAPTSFAGEGISVLNESISLRIKHMDRLGEDIKIVAELHEGDKDVYGNN